MFLFFTTIFLIIQLPSTVTQQWGCIFCFFPYYPQPYPYFYPPVITPPTFFPSYRSIGPCVNGRCPAGYGCYNSQYGPCVNNQCPMGFCYNGQCVG
ncbi:unnamed protein product [Cercopithifilaria johnstoni]|uniref:Uncharacterized protein n=1 Tax=Cercopithifilaria johnstoni TaxID=2874296 RepID=A0A8J2MLU9_9BILA|nr:unnamed protein product [Cercopithifilaria johnstoni]